MNMKSLFLGIEFSGPAELLLRILLFALVSALLMWILNLIFQGAKNKSSQKSDLRIRHRFLYTLVVYLVLFSIFLGVVIFINGKEAFDFNSPRLYLGIAHFIMAYMGTIILFFVNYSILNKQIN